MLITGVDGVDHINVYSKGHTKLGIWLSNFSKSPIVLETHGAFESIEGYWYWLGCRDERLRQVYGYNAKKLGKSIERIYSEPNFEELIKRAIDIKLKSNKEILILFASSTLPFTHYYEYGQKKIDAGYGWIINHLEQRRKLLKEYWKV